MGSEAVNILLYIVGVPVVVGFMIWLLFGGADRAVWRATGTGPYAPKYWRCTANHNHRTPEAARRCSAAQRRG
jgi:hypothetical protein